VSGKVSGKVKLQGNLASMRALLVEELGVPEGGLKLCVDAVRVIEGTDRCERSMRARLDEAVCRGGS
jgi:hypothetical protein